MITNAYDTEQIAAAYRREAERAGAASRLAREARGGQSTAPGGTAPVASSSERSTVRFARPRRWAAIFVAGVR